MTHAVPDDPPPPLLVFVWSDTGATVGLCAGEEVGVDGVGVGVVAVVGAGVGVGVGVGLCAGAWVVCCVGRDVGDGFTDSGGCGAVVCTGVLPDTCDECAPDT
jgi:hypothetical protein